MKKKAKIIFVLLEKKVEEKLNGEFRKKVIFLQRLSKPSGTTKGTFFKKKSIFLKNTLYYHSKKVY